MDAILNGHKPPEPFFANGDRPSILGPDGLPYRQSEGPAIPTVVTYAGLLNAASRSLSYRWDEAYRRSRTDALAMTRDAWLMALLRERVNPIKRMPWHIEPEDARNPGQVEGAKLLTSIVNNIPRFRSRYLASLLWAIWYGRAAAQQVFGKREILGQERVTVTEHFAVNGDKIQFDWDGTPRIMVYAGSSPELEAKGAKIVQADRSRMVELNTPYWRDRFAIHKHDCIDSDFFSPAESGSIHGVGLRHWCYWFWWMKVEVQSWLMDFMERTGLGLTIYFYDDGNPNGAAQAEAAAKRDGRNTVIVWPRSREGKDVGPGIERIETQTAGAEVIREIIDYFDSKLERFIVGQSMSGGGDAKDGLGGTGRAQFAQNTKAQIIEDDADNLQETLTEELLPPLVRYNPDILRCKYRFIIDVEKPDMDKKLDAAKTLFDMGMADLIKAREVMEAAGLSVADETDLTVGQLMKKQQQEQAAQQMQQQGLQTQAGTLTPAEHTPGGDVVDEISPSGSSDSVGGANGVAPPVSPVEDNDTLEELDDDGFDEGVVEPDEPEDDGVPEPDAPVEHAATSDATPVIEEPDDDGIAYSRDVARALADATELNSLLANAILMADEDEPGMPPLEEPELLARKKEDVYTEEDRVGHEGAKEKASEPKDVEMDWPLYERIRAVFPKESPEKDDLPFLCGVVDDGTGEIEIYLADFDKIMTGHDMDSSQGLNGLEDPKACGPKQVVVDGNMLPSEWLPVCVHEMEERRDMEQDGSTYEKAHLRANAIERQIREKMAKS